MLAVMKHPLLMWLKVGFLNFNISIINLQQKNLELQNEVE
jgi:hypothetical protein